MGTVKCERCGGHIEADSIEDAAKRIDHAVGLSKGKPCDEARAVLVMVGEPQAPKQQPKVEKKVEAPKATKTSEKEAP